MTLTAQDLIDAARIRHWSFADVILGDGAAVLFLNHRQRHLLLRYREQLQGFINTTFAQAGVQQGVLVGLDANGALITLDTFVDGFAAHVNANGTPYVDTTDAPIAYDPLGARGGTNAGWPLPTDAIAVFTLSATLQDGSTTPIDIVIERDRYTAPAGHYLAVYLSGNRLVPIRPVGSLFAGDAWGNVVSVTLSYLPLKTVALLTDTMTVPAPLIEPLIANLAELFAKESKLCTVAERQQFATDARKAEGEIDDMGYDVLGQAQIDTVLYEG